MSIKETIKETAALFIPLLLAGAALLLWLNEIFIKTGWKSTKWIDYPFLSVYIISFLTVFAYLLPIIIFKKVKIINLSLSFLTIYIASIWGYFSSKSIFVKIYDKIEEDTHLVYIWSLFLIVCIVSSVYFYSKQFLLYKSDRFHVMTLVIVFISVIPASLITVEWIPGYGNNITFIDSVKMGYPIFWLIVMLGFTSFLMVKKLI